ncbi:hypothetical protein M422DRAFT_70591 [Sphaerobolus stellatus SS14]|uniref:Uncharacterized protein n=1 Tax=Sphaerobolus stellatus (strain SS14) TaxID=990650 RepID=A0A0C9UCQ4_SPHS4|nr:hypothetical protein M422DRAFT_70591 [Sphaerobolus stellatus SS14]
MAHKQHYTGHPNMHQTSGLISNRFNDPYNGSYTQHRSVSTGRVSTEAGYQPNQQTATPSLYSQWTGRPDEPRTSSLYSQWTSGVSTQCGPRSHIPSQEFSQSQQRLDEYSRSSSVTTRHNVQHSRGPSSNVTSVSYQRNHDEMDGSWNVNTGLSDEKRHSETPYN